MARPVDFTARPTSVKQILKLIDCPLLNLHKGNGYWYFEYDDCAANNVFETESIDATMRLSDLSLGLWVQTGRDFVARVKAERY